jgi:hypothetical protein
MHAVREVAFDLAREGRIQVLRKGKADRARAGARRTAIAFALSPALAGERVG